MMRRSTWIVLGIFILLVAFVLIFQRYQANQPDNTATATPTTPATYLYNLGNVLISHIKIADKSGKYVDMYKDPMTGKWAIEGVPPEAADSSQIEALSSQLLGVQVLDTLTQTLSMAAVGLDTPAYTITLTTSAGTQDISYIGMQTAIGTGYYVRDGTGPVMIVDKTTIDSILAMLTTPPMLPTATPGVSPSPVTLLTPGVSPSPMTSPTAPVVQETPTP